MSETTCSHYDLSLAAFALSAEVAHTFTRCGCLNQNGLTEAKGDLFKAIMFISVIIKAATTREASFHSTIKATCYPNYSG